MKIKTLIMMVLLLVVILSAFMGFSLFLQPGTNDRPVMVEVSRGAASSQIAVLLQKNGVIKRKLDFKVAVALLGLQNNLKAGRYKFPARSLLYNVLLKLKAGKTAGEEPLRITFPEGTSIYKMGSILEANTVECYSDFRKLVNRKLEGYLYPDTYIFDQNITAEALANMMIKRFNEVVIPYWNANQDQTKYTFEQILTLASIIEKEAALESERPIISSVFHNRMDINMALDSCSTVKYALERPTKVVYFDQLKYPSPYNTYTHRGLPPGPICNPGLNSIKAAIYPAKTDYLYFVANKDGSHTFSSSFAGHQQARVKKK